MVPPGKMALTASPTEAGVVPRDLADQVHHVAVALHRERLADAHRAGQADARQVVAEQVDEHHVLGLLLDAGAHLGLEAVVFRRVGGARPGAGDRPRAHLVRRRSRKRRSGLPETTAQPSPSSSPMNGLGFTVRSRW